MNDAKQSSRTKSIAVFSDDGHQLFVNPGGGGKRPGTGQAEWIVKKEYRGWTVRHARNGVPREATGAEVVMAEAISQLITLAEEH